MDVSLQTADTSGCIVSNEEVDKPKRFGQPDALCNMCSTPPAPADATIAPEHSLPDPLPPWTEEHLNNLDSFFLPDYFDFGLDLRPPMKVEGDLMDSESISGSESTDSTTSDPLSPSSSNESSQILQPEQSLNSASASSGRGRNNRTNEEVKEILEQVILLPQIRRSMMQVARFIAARLKNQEDPRNRRISINNFLRRIKKEPINGTSIKSNLRRKLFEGLHMITLMIAVFVSMEVSNLVTIHLETQPDRFEIPIVITPRPTIVIPVSRRRLISPEKIELGFEYLVHPISRITPVLSMCSLRQYTVAHFRASTCGYPFYTDTNVSDDEPYKRANNPECGFSLLYEIL